MLNDYAYFNDITVKTDWSASEFPTYEELERIRNNVKILKEVYFSLTQIPENLDYMTYEKANDIEKILFEIDKILGDMESNFVYCGVPSCGQDRIWQQRFRKPKTWISQPYKLSQYADTDTVSLITEKRIRNLLIKDGLSTSSSDNTFWNSRTNSTPLEDGWVRAECINDTTTTKYANQFTKIGTISDVEPNTSYTIYVEIRNLEYTGLCGMNLCGAETATIWSNACVVRFNNTPDITRKAWIVKTKADLTGKTLALRNFLYIDANSSVKVEYRMMVIKGEYTLDEITEYKKYEELETLENRTSNMMLAQIDKRDSVYPSINTINESMNTIDDLVGVNYIDYLETTGTQRINTGYIPNQNTKVEISIISSESSGKWLFGARASQSVGNYGVHISNPLTGIIWFQYYTDSTGSITTNINMTENKMIIKTDKNVLYVNGEKKQTLATNVFDSRYPMALFTMNTGGYVDTRMFIGQFFYCKIWDNDVLVRDFRPCKDFKGVYCLFDKVSKTYFYNQGTGSFGGA